MKTIAMAMILIGAGGLAWTIIDKLSTDAIGMAIGMTLGVLAGTPTAALVLLARRRDDEDSWHPIDVDYPLPPAQPVHQVETFHEDVTPTAT